MVPHADVQPREMIQKDVMDRQTWSLTATATATATVSSAELGKHPDIASKQIEPLPVSILAECTKAADDIDNGGSFHG